MRMSTWALIAVVLGAGCTAADPPSEGTPDGGPALDAGAVSDAGAEAGAGPDARLDGPPDAMPDDGMDAALDAGRDPDAAPTVDALIDAAVDATPMADVAPDAAVDARVEPDATIDAAPEPDAVVDAETDATVDAAPEPDAAVDAAPEPDATIDAAPEPDCRVDDDCLAAEQCLGGLCLPRPDGTCRSPFAGELDGIYRGVTGGVGTDGGSCPGNNDLTAPEAIYRVVFPADGPYCVNTRGSAFDTMLYVRTACGDPRTEVACQDDDFPINGAGGWAALTLDAEAFRVYYVTVDGYGSVGEAPREGEYRLSLTAGACQAPPECTPETEAADCGPARRCGDGRCVECIDETDCAGGVCAEGACVGCIDDGDCPAAGRCVDAVCEVDVGAGGACAAPTDAVAGVRYVGATAGAGALVGSCGAIGEAVDAPEAVFGFVAPRAGRWCASTAGSALDTALYVRRDCFDPSTEISCSDDAFELTGGPQGALTLQAAAGEGFAIIVDGFALPGNGEAGPFVLRITEGACVAP